MLEEKPEPPALDLEGVYGRAQIASTQAERSSGVTPEVKAIGMFDPGVIAKAVKEEKEGTPVNAGITVAARQLAGMSDRILGDTDIVGLVDQEGKVDGRLPLDLIEHRTMKGRLRLFGNFLLHAAARAKDKRRPDTAENRAERMEHTINQLAWPSRVRNAAYWAFGTSAAVAGLIYMGNTSGPHEVPTRLPIFDVKTEPPKDVTQAKKPVAEDIPLGVASGLDVGLTTAAALAAWLITIDTRPERAHRNAERKVQNAARNG